ncbi:MAG: FtsX-like permease family protein [Protaetiibacter sp.]
MTRLTTPRLLAVHLRSGLAAAALTGVLVAVTVLVAAGVPSALSALAAAQLQHAASELPSARRDLTATGPLGFQFTAETDTELRLASIDRGIEGFPAQYGEPLASGLDGGDWVASTRMSDAFPTEPSPTAPRLTLSLSLDTGWAERVRIIEGTEPDVWSGTLDTLPGSPAQPPVPIAISAELAKTMQLELGDDIQLAEALLQVAGIYEPLDPGAGYWQHAPLLREPIVAPPPDYQATASVYVAPGSAHGLWPWLATATVAAWWSVNPDALTATGGPALMEAFHESESYGNAVISGTELHLSSSLPDALDAASARLRFVLALLALVAAGPLGVVFAVDAQAAQAVIARRRPALALASARGASTAQLRLIMATEGLLIGVPAALLGYLATRMLFPADFAWEGVTLAIVFALAPAVLFAALTPARIARSERSDVAVRSRSATRWVVEVAAVGLAGLAVFLLFRRGFAEASAEIGVDPLLAAVPLLLAIAGCVVALRVYPALLLLVHRLARGTPGAVPLLGAARAVRTPALGFATGFALLVGVSISVFSTGIASTVQAAIAQALALPSDDNERFASLAEEPVMTGLTLMLLLSAVIATLLGALAVVLGSIAASESRNRLLGVARVLGFSTRQLGALVGWELAPLAVVAIAVGAAVGAGELHLVLAALDLRPFLGTTDAVGAVLDPLWVAGVIAVFTVVVLVAGFVTASIARRVSPVSTIKMGAE